MRLILVTILLLGVAGCDFIQERFSSPPAYDTVDRPPPGPPGQCRAACEGSYDRCFDTEAARRDPGNAFFGGGAVCDRELQRCLRRCAGEP